MDTMLRQARRAKMQDQIAKSRVKSRHIFEVRYTPLHQIFDSKGKLIEAIEKDFKEKLPHWRLQNVPVQFSDDFDSPKKQIHADHLRTSFLYEDPGSISEFYDDSKKYFKIFFSVFPDAFSKIKRVGHRRISVFSLPGMKSYDDCLSLIISTFYSGNTKLSFKFSDCRFTFVHELGQATIGPVKKGEPWLKEFFSLPELNVPNFGIGLDVDSAAINPKLSDLESFRSTASAASALSDKIEEEVFRSFKAE